MSPPHLGIDGEVQGNVSLLSSSTSLDCISKNVLGMKERNYLGLSDSSSSSVGSPAMLALTKENKGILNLDATELRLGLPGSESSDRGKDLNLLSCEAPGEKLLFSLLPSKDGIYSSASRTIVTGNKRGFSDTINGFPAGKNAQSAGQGKLSVKSGINVLLPNKASGSQPTITSEGLSKAPMEEPPMKNGSSLNKNVSNSGSSPVAKAQVVGWPPVRSFRKNTLANTSKNNDEVDGKQSPGALFVKVSMDGAPYLRKVDLRSYSTYQELSSALEKMFSCFTLGKSGANEGPGSENKLRASLRGSEYVLTFEDKDGDWMLVGDVPWEMFIGSCKRLKIMKGSDAIGLAPRANGEVQD